VRIRDAHEHDAQVLTDLMRSAKRSWGYPDAWMETWAAGLTITPEDTVAMRVRVASQWADNSTGCSQSARHFRASRAC